MSRIQVNPDTLRRLSQDLSRPAADLRALAGRLSGALNSLDWQARQKAGVDGLWQRAGGQAGDLAQQAQALARYLQQKAETFEDADRQGVAALAAVFPEALPIAGWRLPSLPWPLPALALIPIPAIRLPTIPWPLRIQIWPPKVVWPWDVKPEPSVDIGPRQGGFGDLLDGQDQPQVVTPDPPAAPEEPATASGSAQVQPARDEWWADVPTQSQQGLKVPGGAQTAYGCAPTSVSMILDYWHTQDPEHNRTMSAQELININANEGEFAAVGGMSPTKLHDELQDLGYGSVEDRSNATQQDLEDAVKRGPVVAIVKLGMGTSGTAHAIVVTGISNDGQVRINDPWDGQSHTYSWEQFARSWGADFGENVAKNNLMIIRP